MMNLFILFMSRAFAEGAEAAAEAAEHAHGIPWHSLQVQTINCFILFGGLALVIAKPLKKHFTERAQTYRELVDRADNARKEAERSKNEMKARIDKLEATAVKGVEQARSEASDLRAKMMEEAKHLSRRLEQEAQRAAQIELEKAKNELRKELLEKAIAETEDKLLKHLSHSDQKNLQNEFAEKIETVRG
jgi:F-type H+-transporting ATPase subunit b